MLLSHVTLQFVVTPFQVSYWLTGSHFLLADSGQHSAHSLALKHSYPLGSTPKLMDRQSGSTKSWSKACAAWWPGHLPAGLTPFHLPSVTAFSRVCKLSSTVHLWLQYSSRTSDCPHISEENLMRLSPSERNFSIRDHKLLAIKMAFVEWRHFLEGSSFPLLLGQITATWST